MKISLLNKTKIASVLLIYLMLSLPSVASAIDFLSSNNPTYFGVGYGKTKLLFDIENATDLDDKDNGFIGFVGKRYNKNMDIEAFYTQQGKFEEDGGGLLKPRSVSVTVFGVKANYKFSLDNDSFTPYITAGGANVDVKAKNLTEDDVSDGFKLIYGAGVQYKQSKDITLRAEYLDTRGTTFMWGGVSTKF